MTRISISCTDPAWHTRLELALQTGSEADLLEFQYPQHGSFAEHMATKYNLHFALHRDPLIKIAHLRKHS